jgi:hypothetical protein
VLSFVAAMLYAISYSRCQWVWKQPLCQRRDLHRCHLDLLLPVSPWFSWLQLREK